MPKLVDLSASARVSGSSKGDPFVFQLIGEAHDTVTFLEDTRHTCPRSEYMLLSVIYAMRALRQRLLEDDKAAPGVLRGEGARKFFYFFDITFSLVVRGRTIQIDHVLLTDPEAPDPHLESSFEAWVRARGATRRRKSGSGGPLARLFGPLIAGRSATTRAGGTPVDRDTLATLALAGLAGGIRLLDGDAMRSPCAGSIVVHRPWPALSPAFDFLVSRRSSVATAWFERFGHPSPDLYPPATPRSPRAMEPFSLADMPAMAPGTAGPRRAEPPLPQTYPGL